ncbi:MULTISPECIES: hexokinase family protein [unclassified Oceanispirochaeta]|uniref:hexokinase family protein n=1 Tax=unclassified Oceanispirochaeta TaxID=2635722 RepID=UPI0013141D86|nr:hexokinase [Oceanispirochaeta sp. M1]MBF9017035.1 hexokinase [Oceanispirochaeta sp. M2]NPD73484.1 hexokinase [Oceanispirochaeta sp. M1]
MSELKNKVESFLRKYKMHSDSVDLNKCVQDFMGEMEKGLAGNSSIAMIPTYIEIDNPIPPSKKVVVIDAGGTNLRTALVSFDENYKPLIENFNKYPMPGTGGAVGKDKFFDMLADYIVDLVPKGDKIGFCFSYPTEMFPNKDGKLIKFSKEVECPEVHGELIGENLLAYLRKKGVTEEREIVILNDTVATLLTGMISFPDQVFSAYVGYIFGTGINSCYVESNSNIKKLRGMDPSHNQVINTECGSFGLPPQGDIDKELDAGTSDPGHYFLEKMVSGGYFGLVVTKTLDKAIQDDLFTSEAKDILSDLGRLSTKDVDDYLHNPNDNGNILVKALKGCSIEDKETLFYLINNLLDRAARLAASSLAGTLLKSGEGKSPLRPVCLTVDGTTFYCFYQFRTRVEQYLREILSGDQQRYYEIVRVEDAPLLGAAIAALTN